MSALKNPAVYACVAALLAVIGIELREVMWENILEIAAAVCAIIGIIFGVQVARKTP